MPILQQWCQGMPNPLVRAINPFYQQKLMLMKGFDLLPPIGQLFPVRGFDDFNQLITLNSVFSTQPRYGIIDRTQTVQQPIDYHVGRPWQVPDQELTLDQAIELTVRDIEQACRGTINVLWSGGIDSTFAITGLLKHRSQHQPLRVLYSPWSTYEHPEYLHFLKQFNNVECVDISGTVYLSFDQFDGVFVVGDGGDELHASLDESFLETHGWQVLDRPWIDFFRQLGHSDSFIEFCNKFFSHAGRPIITVLEARWWFYMTCKFSGIFEQTKVPFFVNHLGGTDVSRVIQFLDNDHYQKFIYYNTDKIVNIGDYTTWRQILKDYCCEFDGLETWRSTHKKVHSRQFNFYGLKKLALTNNRWLMTLSDGTRITTPSLPLFSAKEFDAKYGNSLDYLFNNDRH
jgi:hypothetical protein